MCVCAYICVCVCVLDIKPMRFEDRVIETRYRSSRCTWLNL